MQKNNEVKFEVLRLPPTNTNSLLVSKGTDAVISDPWGRASDWERVMIDRGLKLRAIYATHGHPDHISAAPGLALDLNVNWFLNAKDNYLIAGANSFLDMFQLPHISGDYKKPMGISAGGIEILPGVKTEVIESPGHTPGGVMYHFPQYRILLIGDTLFQESVGRYDLPGGNVAKLFESIRALYDMNLDDKTYVVHGHGMETTIEWLKRNNPFFSNRKYQYPNYTR